MPKDTSEDILRELEKQIKKLSPKDYEQIRNLCFCIRQREVRLANETCLKDEEVRDRVKDSLDYMHELNKRRTTDSSSSSKPQTIDESNESNPILPILILKFFGYWIDLTSGQDSIHRNPQVIMPGEGNANPSPITRKNTNFFSDIALESQKQILAIVHFLNQDDSKTQDSQQRNVDITDPEKAIKNIQKDLSSFHSELKK